jgi:hypothetical protein
VISGALFLVHGKLIASLAGRYRVPAIYARREFAEAGGLMSYGYDIADGFRLLGGYAGRILMGEKAGGFRSGSSSTGQRGSDHVRKTPDCVGAAAGPDRRSGPFPASRSAGNTGHLMTRFPCEPDRDRLP